MKAKWFCKCCGLSGELDTPITMQRAYVEIARVHDEDELKKHRSCPAVATRAHCMLTLDLNPDDVLGASGLLARTGRREFVLYLLAVQ